MRAAVLHRIVLSTFLLVALLAQAAPARAQDEPPIKPEARARFARGLEYYKMKEYEAAISEFEAAYAIDPRNEILFAQAQAERLSGDCASAVTLYRHFLDGNPPAIHAEAARASLDKCETALKSTPEGEKTPTSNEPPPSATPPSAPADSTPAEPAATPATTATPAHGESRPFYKDPLGDTFAITGVIAIGVGVGLYLASSDDVSAADEATSYSEHARLYDRAESRRTYAFVGLGAGAALLAGAAVRWMWPGSESSTRTDVALDVRGDGASLVLAGSF
jgi:tetratricopeptide (TPR) repeat protein